MTSAGYLPPLIMVMRRPPANCCHWCMTTCGASPNVIWHERTPGQTLTATALVHEAYLRLVGPTDGDKWDHRGHFYFAAAEAMRRILIDRARSKQRLKRGGNLKRLKLDEVDLGIHSPPDEILALDEALTDLESHNPQAAELVKLRFFGGLGHQEAAEAMGIGRRSADGLWVIAKTWLFDRLSRDR